MFFVGIYRSADSVMPCSMFQDGHNSRQGSFPLTQDATTGLTAAIPAGCLSTTTLDTCRVLTIVKQRHASKALYRPTNGYPKYLADTSSVCTCRIFVHHYTEYMDAAVFDEAAESLNSLIADYKTADTAAPAPVTRMRPRGLSFL